MPARLPVRSTSEPFTLEHSAWTIVARHGGMEVLGLALVTNAAAGVLPSPIRHEDVLEAGAKATPMLGKLIRRIVLRVADAAPGNVGFSDEVPAYRPD